jgi:hypothetical protein
MIHGRGRPGDVRWTAFLAQVLPRDHGGRQRQKYIAHLASFLRSKDGSVVDGDAFLAKAMAKLNGLGDILTSVERRRIQRAMVTKMRRPIRTKRAGLLDRRIGV